MLQNQSPFGTLGQSSAATNQDGRFSATNYLIRRKILKLVGKSFYVEAPEGNVILYADMKAFKLKEDIRLYTGEDKSQEVLRIGARNILDVSATYDIFDSATNTKIGALRRKGLKSVIRDEWIILDTQDREMGTIVEDSMVLALVRRFVEYAAFFLPQKYTVSVGNRQVGALAQTYSPLVANIRADFSMDPEGILDRRIGIVAAILMSAVEGKQG
jgi:uncharacterized protein YxjI